MHLLPLDCTIPRDYPAKLLLNIQKVTRLIRLNGIDASERSHFPLSPPSLPSNTLQTTMSNDVAEPRRGGRERKQVEKFEPQRELYLAHSRQELIDQEVKKEKLVLSKVIKYVPLSKPS
jgi:hypothetical protein